MPQSRPSIQELGPDLLVLSKTQLLVTLGLPVTFFTLYFVFAIQDLWYLAVPCTMALSFCTYGSTSHDLVHGNLRINTTLNTILLFLIELLCFRSGHSYKLSHLYHHKRFPNEDDVEGAASQMTLLRTLLEGIIFQPKIYFWAIFTNKDHRYRLIILSEGILILIIIGLAMISLPYTDTYFVYMCLMVAGSWIIPLITSYAVHTPTGQNELLQTRLFRGTFFSTVAFNHLFHLEHHLYPMVPHKNWPELARRLDYYFKREGIKPFEIKL
jgi:beta-carotene hydroxylase